MQPLVFQTPMLFYFLLTFGLVRASQREFNLFYFLGIYLLWLFINYSQEGEVFRAIPEPKTDHGCNVFGIGETVFVKQKCKEG